MPTPSQSNGRLPATAITGSLFSARNSTSHRVLLLGMRPRPQAGLDQARPRPVEGQFELTQAD